ITIATTITTPKESINSDAPLHTPNLDKVLDPEKSTRDGLSS
ncbi:unnamed protein product, partial [Adineta steineri]